MRNSSQLFALLLFATATALSSCKQEPDPAQEYLTGRWEIREAFRNGKPTESLADLYFEFGNDGNMRTNLPVSETPGNARYELHKNHIRQQQGEMGLEYTIESISDTSLVLTTTLRDFNFRFVLGKQTNK